MVEPFEPDRTTGCSCWHGRSGSPFSELIEQVGATMRSLAGEVATPVALDDHRGAQHDVDRVAAPCRELVTGMATRVRQMRALVAEVFAPLRAKAAAAERVRRRRSAQGAAAAAAARHRERRLPRRLASVPDDGDDGDADDAAGERGAISGRCA